MGNIAVILGMLTLAGQQAAQHLFGGYLHGSWMRYVAIGTTIGIAALCKTLALPFFPFDWPWVQVLALGLLAGLGANVFHALLPKGANDTTVSHSIGKKLKRAASATTARPGTSPGLPPQPPR